MLQKLCLRPLGPRSFATFSATHCYTTLIQWNAFSISFCSKWKCLVANPGKLPESNFKLSSCMTAITVYIFQDSKLFAHVACYAELVYGPFGQRKVHRTLNFCPDKPCKNKSNIQKPQSNTQSCIKGLLVVPDFCFWTDYEQLLRAVFSCFWGQKIFFRFF